MFGLFFGMFEYFFGEAKNEAGVGGGKSAPKWAPNRGWSMGSQSYCGGSSAEHKSDNLMAKEQLGKERKCKKMGVEIALYPHF